MYPADVLALSQIRFILDLDSAGSVCARRAMGQEHRKPRLPKLTRRNAMKKYTKPELTKHATLKQVTFSSH